MGLAELFQPINELKLIQTSQPVGGAGDPLLLNTVNNAYAAGLSGDLAEVCVYQGPYVGTNVTVGLTGTWNNTVFPRVRYVLNQFTILPV